MTDEIVTKSPPPAPTQFEMKPFVRPKLGERGEFELALVAEAGPRQTKTATVGVSIPGYSSFTLKCDEGTTYFGDDSAPPPLAYLAAGIAFCLLTHLQALVVAHKLDIRTIKIEQRLRYSSTLGTTMQTLATPDGRCDGLETHVLIDSDEPTQRIVDIVAQAEAACMAHQTVLRPTPASLRLVVNEQEADRRTHNM